MKGCDICELDLDNSNFDKLETGNLRSTCRKCRNIQRSQRLAQRNSVPLIEGTKDCCYCKETKSVLEYGHDKQTPDGLCRGCKACRRERERKRYEQNPEKIKEGVKRYQLENKEKVRSSRRKYQNNRLKEDPKFMLIRRLRNRLYYALQKKSWKNDTHFAEYIGCTLDELKAHIESQFLPGMSWENQDKWEIDHKVAISSATSEEELYRLSHFKNLQPLWTADNRAKGNRPDFIIRKKVDTENKE